MKKAWVTTILRQEISVPDHWEREDVLDFLAEHQSFRTAFQGVTNAAKTSTIVDLHVVEEEITELGEESFDA